MGRSLCPRCMQSINDADLFEEGGQKVCVKCRERATQVGDRESWEKRKRESEAGKTGTLVLSNLQQPPRELSPMIVQEFKKRNAGLRTFLYFISIVSFLSLPVLGSYLWIELGQMEGWQKTSGTVVSVHPLDGDKVSMTFRYAVKGVASMTEVQLQDGRAVGDDIPVEMVGDGPNKKNQMVESSVTVSLEEQLGIGGPGAKVNLLYNPEMPRQFAGEWKFSGAGFGGQKEKVKAEHMWPGILILCLAFGSLSLAGLSSYRVRRQMKIFSTGEFILATSAVGAATNRAEHLVDFILSGAFFISFIGPLFVKRAPYLWFVKTEIHSAPLFLWLPAGSNPWIVQKKPVICFLPDSPRSAILVPAEVGWRMAIK